MKHDSWCEQGKTRRKAGGTNNGSIGEREKGRELLDSVQMQLIPSGNASAPFLVDTYWLLL